MILIRQCNLYLLISNRRDAQVKIQHTEMIDLQCKKDEEALLKESQTLMLKIETLKEFETSLLK